jgi:cytochrome c5
MTLRPHPLASIFAAVALVGSGCRSGADPSGAGDDSPGTTDTDPPATETDETGDPTGTPPVAYDGREVFRHDTFGDEVLWTDTLRIHEVVQTLSPTDALGVGLKVDAAAVPADVLAAADLTDPATTASLLSLGAVVGVEATVDAAGTITRLGVTCALCHSTVDDSAAPGIGQRLDGHPNRDLQPGTIISLSPTFDTQPDVRALLQSWGPGRYDPYWNHDGLSYPVLIPPAYGLRDVALETYTGEGPVSYWNAYVAITQMGGLGTFVSEELGISVVNEPDLVTPKLPALADYQFTLEPPAPDPTTFDAAAATRGAALFEASCATCHAGSSFTDAPVLHAAAEVGQDPVYATRGTTGSYRTTPLRGVASHPPYFHDGSAATLADVVTRYDTHLALGLSAGDRGDLEAYLRSL